MPKKNGFVVFMEARRPELLAAGRTLSGGLKELVDLCGEDWAALPDAEKRAFNDRAKLYNEQMKKRGDEEKPSSTCGNGSARENASSSTPRNAIAGQRAYPPIQRNASAGQRALNSPQKTVGAFIGPVATLGSPESKKQPIETANPYCLTGEDTQQIEENREIVNRFFENPGWIEEPIVICSFTMYVEPDHNVLFLPAEIGLTAMNLRRGVLDNFARIIDPGDIPKGHGVEASKTAVELGLPELGKYPELADYSHLMMTLRRFLVKYKGRLEGRDLYVFAFESDYVMVTQCLRWLFDTTNHRLPVKVLSLDSYVWKATSSSKRAKELRGRTIESLLLFGKDSKGMTSEITPYRTVGKSLTGNFVYSSITPTCAYGVFTAKEDVDACIKGVDNYKYYKELCCLYHYKSGTAIENCALVMSNRYAFSILEILTISNQVQIIPGGHYPDIDNSEVESNRRFLMLKQWGLTALESQMEVETHTFPPFPESERDRRRRQARYRNNNVRMRENPEHVRVHPDHVNVFPDHFNVRPDHVRGRPEHARVRPEHTRARPDHTVSEGNGQVQRRSEKNKDARVETEVYYDACEDPKVYVAARQRLQDYDKYNSTEEYSDGDTSNPYSGSIPSIYRYTGSSASSHL